jgi:putative transcriptional regulator
MILKTGNILIAEPFMLDSSFKRSVVLLTDYNEVEGSFGFILNRMTEFMLSDLTDDFPNLHSAIYYGGPVGVNSLYFVHNCGDILDDSIKITNGIFWSGNYEKLKFLVDTKLINTGNIRFYLGYSGWDPGQLEGELKENSWIVSDMDPNYLFKIHTDELWKETLENKGKHYGILGQIPDDLLMN